MTKRDDDDSAPDVGTTAEEITAVDANTVLMRGATRMAALTMRLSQAVVTLITPNTPDQVQNASVVAHDTLDALTTVITAVRQAVRERNAHVQAAARSHH